MSDPTRRRWVVLAVGLGAMTAGCAFQFGLPYLIPALRKDGLELGEATLLVACPMAGLLLTLVAWGAAADRWGERLVLSLGLAIACAALAAAAMTDDPVPMGACLVLAGAGGASVHAASGRLILGWFDADERGLAMAVRQTAQPLGVAVAAAALPTLGEHGTATPLFTLGGFCLLMSALVILLVRDPVRPATGTQQRSGSPYTTSVLPRLHAASALLVVPQFTVATFALVYLVDDHDWSATTAGRVLAGVQILGALARIGAGVWSDQVGSRLGPYRILALAIGGVMLALVLGAFASSTLAIVALMVAGVITVSPNGLAFTAVAEYAGRSWAGRALGIQNTLQNGLAMATAPVLGVVVGGTSYAVAFATAVAFPLAAATLTPVRAERHTAQREPVLSAASTARGCAGPDR